MPLLAPDCHFHLLSACLNYGEWEEGRHSPPTQPLLLISRCLQTILRKAGYFRQPRVMGGRWVRGWAKGVVGIKEGPRWDEHWVSM